MSNKSYPMATKQINIKKQLKKLARKELARRDFWFSCLYLDYEFFSKRSKVLKPIARLFQRLIAWELIGEEELDLITVSVPPRTGKSYILSHFNAWALGRFPEGSIMRNSNSANLAFKFSNDTKNIMKSTLYTELWGKTNFLKDSANEWKLDTAKTGISYFGAGIRGQITGFGATLLAEIDDPIKGDEEALNEDILEKKWAWYTAVHVARMEKKCKEIHIATRWSTKDLIGRLEESGYLNNKRFASIKIPAIIINELGKEESFCDDVHPIKYYNNMRNVTDELIFEAEFMQNPVEAKGRLYNPDKLNKFTLEMIKNSIPDSKIAICDIADEGSDALCFLIAYIFGKDVYIVDTIFTKDKIELTQPRVAEMLIKHGVANAFFESNNGGKGYALEIKRLIKEYNGNTTIVWKHTTQNKHTKIIMNSGQIKQYFHFRTDVNKSSEYARYIMQLCKYNRSGNNKHDDAPDATTMVNIYLNDQLTVNVW